MFGVIKIERIGGGFFKRLHYRLFPPEPVIERISVLGSAPFFTLTLVCDENEEVDTGEIYSLLGRCAGRVIVCGGTITEDEKVKNFEPRILPSVMLFNSAVDYIKKCSLPPEKTSVAVMDFNGFQKDKLSLLVPLASNLKVITGNPEEFSPVRRRLYDDWGLAMTVTENVNEAGGCTFVIAPRTDKSNPDGGCLLYRNEYSGSTVCLSGSGVTLPDDITKVLPPCNSLLFASALYELCGATRLSELCFDRLADNSSKGSLSVTMRFFLQPNKKSGTETFCFRRRRLFVYRALLLQNNIPPR